MTSNRTSRRNYIKALGIGVGAASLGGVVSATKSQETVSTEDAGIDTAVENLLQNQKIEQAVNLLEQAGAKYYHVRQFAPGAESGTDSGEMSTMDFFKKSSSTIDHLVYWKSGIRYKQGLYWNLKGGMHDYDGPKPADAVVLAFDSGKIDFVPGSLNYGGQLGNNPMYDDQTVPLEWPTKADAEHRDRVVAKFKDGSVQSTAANGFLEMKMDFFGSGSAWVSSNYTHTWSFLNNAQWSDIAAAVSVSTKGGIGISVPTQADSWEVDAVQVI